MAHASSQRGKVTLRHYTDEAGAQGIQNKGVIYQSTRAQGGDAAFGNGAYLTGKHPSEGKHGIAANNYDSRTNEYFLKQQVKSGKLDYYVQVDLPKSSVEKCDTHDGRDVYKVPGDLHITKEMNPRIGVTGKR